MSHRLVILESPFSGDVEANILYARAALRDSLLRGESPIAFHLLYTQPGVLDDTVPEERSLGIGLSFWWYMKAYACVAYIDRGISPGMELGLENARRRGLPIEYRTIFADG